jgi:hypothetical protein
VAEPGFFLGDPDFKKKKKFMNEKKNKVEQKLIKNIKKNYQTK